MRKILKVLKEEIIPEIINDFLLFYLIVSLGIVIMLLIFDKIIK